MHWLAKDNRNTFMIVAIVAIFLLAIIGGSAAYCENIKTKYVAIIHKAVDNVEFGRKKVNEPHSEELHDGYVAMYNAYLESAKLIADNPAPTTWTRRKVILAERRGGRLWAKYSVIEQQEDKLVAIANCVYGTNTVVKGE